MIYGFQLWVNLPAAQKMSQPRYQEVSAADIPAVEKDGRQQSAWWPGSSPASAGR